MFIIIISQHNSHLHLYYYYYYYYYYTGQQISNNFLSVVNMLLIYLFESMKLENGHKKDYLALVLKLCFTMLFYEIG